MGVFEQPILPGYLTTYAALIFDSIQHSTFGPITIFNLPPPPNSRLSLTDTPLHWMTSVFHETKRWRKLEESSLTGTKRNILQGWDWGSTDYNLHAERIPLFLSACIQYVLMNPAWCEKSLRLYEHHQMSLPCVE